MKMIQMVIFIVYVMDVSESSHMCVARIHTSPLEPVTGGQEGSLSFNSS